MAATRARVAGLVRRALGPRTLPVAVWTRALAAGDAGVCALPGPVAGRLAGRPWPISFPAAAFSAAAAPDVPSPVITTLADFRALTQLSLNAPIVVYATQGSTTAVDSGLVKAVAGAGGAIRLARLDLSARELAPLAGQLGVAQLPATLFLFGGRLMDVQPGAPAGAALADYIAQILRLVDDYAAHKAAQDKGAAGEESAATQAVITPADRLAQGYIMLLDGSQAAETGALPQFQAVLAADSGASDVERARALAGAARCALLRSPPGLEDAAALLDAASKAVPTDKRPGDIAQAEAFLDIARLAAEPGTTDADLQTAHDSQAGKTGAEAAAAAYGRALELFSSRQFAQALEWALQSVRADRAWSDGAARKLLLTMFKALGADFPGVTTARGRLQNLLFI